MNSIVIFFTKNRRLFIQLRSGLKKSVLQQAKTFEGIKDIAKTADVGAIVLHVTDENIWVLFELVRDEYPKTPIYAVLAPSMSGKYDDLEDLAKARGLAAIVSYKNGINELVVALEPAGRVAEFEIKFPEFDFIRPDFVRRMEREIHANRESGKGDWNKWRPEKLLLVSEMNYHLAKLIQALDDGDAEKVSEYSADVANYMMKADEIYGSALPAENEPADGKSKK